MVLTLKLKRKGKFEIIELPPFGTITINDWLTWDKQPCVLECDVITGKVYAYGNEEVRGKWEEGKAVLDMQSFAKDYWRFKILEYGINLFTKAENREERIAIMTTEGETEDSAIKYCDSQPNLY